MWRFRWGFMLSIGSLSTHIFETRTATGRKHFEWQDSAVSQIFILIIPDREKVLSKVNVVVWRQVLRQNISLPFTVRVLKSRMLSTKRRGQTATVSNLGSKTHPHYWIPCSESTSMKSLIPDYICLKLFAVGSPYLFIYLFQGLFYIFFFQYTYSLNLIIHYFLGVYKRLD